ncbi:hypothetical protein ACFO1V_10825 [Daeguia caeni]|uniref:Uncharacterized protein n=1 Tax=Daeguia caeni TaxID=439612 RepID=A0ABV9H9R9_9HYPH
MSKRAGLLASALGFMLLMPSALAAPLCGTEKKPNASEIRNYQQLIAKDFVDRLEPDNEGRALKADQVELHEIVAMDGWFYARIDTPYSETGYFYYDNTNGKPVFRDVMGGMIEPDAENWLLQWFRDLGAPQSVGKCFTRILLSQ